MKKGKTKGIKGTDRETEAHQERMTHRAGSKHTSQSQQNINNLTLRHGKDLITDPLRVSLLEELTLPALTHPSLSCTAEGSGPPYFFLMTNARFFL